MPSASRYEALLTYETPMLAIDTETTGTDFWHGTRPFYFSSCDSNGAMALWEWEVDPLTRKVTIPPDELASVKKLIDDAELLVLQNCKFDIRALYFAGIKDWNWLKTQDTLIASHLLNSAMPHDLTSLCLQYLDIDISPHEQKLQSAIESARKYCRVNLPDWRIAEEGDEMLPSLKGKKWKSDFWLPKAVRQYADFGPEDWDTVLSEYAEMDTQTLVPLWEVLEKEMRRWGLWAIYEERMRLVRAIWWMEQRGVTYSKDRLDSLVNRYRNDQSTGVERMKTIAASFVIDCGDCGGMQGMPCVKCFGKGGIPYKIELPKSGNNQSLTRLLLDIMKLPTRYTEKGNPSVSDDVLEEYLLMMKPDDKRYMFIDTLRQKRKKDKAIEALESYERYSSPVIVKGKELPGFRELHSNLNQTGAATLRCSSTNPNTQNIEKDPDSQGASLREIFGPKKGREWWKIDYENLELRIPAFECGEEELTKVFLRPKDPPYFGSYHLVVFDALYPELFAKHGVECKDLFKATYYQWIKNGNFAILYGAQEKKADATFRVPGAYSKIRSRFPKMAKLSDRMIAHADKLGYVETMPDRNICPERGYPIYCSRSEHGGVQPTVPLNYHVQSTAMWCTSKAMVRCDHILERWRVTENFFAYMVLQVHDELVFDFPAGGAKNRDRVKVLEEAMTASGDDIGVPLTVEATYCPDNWSKKGKL